MPESELYKSCGGTVHYTASGIPAYKTSGGILWHQAFYQRGKKMVLTEAGRLLQSAGLTMRHDECALKEQMARAGAEGRSLHMGATMTIGEFVLPFMLNRFMLNEPEATVHVTVANTTDLLRSIDEGKLDFALVEGYFSGGDYDYQIYSTENISR